MSALVYRFIPGTSADALLLLHGTGGDENDLLQIGRAVMPGAALLSPRGAVLEHGMPRFFRRFAEGVFDIEDIKVRAKELAAFIDEKADEYSLDRARLCVLGYSNGANIAAAMLLTGAAKFRRAALIRAMVPLEPETAPDLAGVEILLAQGAFDTMGSPAQTARLRDLFEAAGAGVTVHNERTAHGLAQGDIDTARQWLARP
jgi:phospholipase/carboxylesterase